MSIFAFCAFLPREFERNRTLSKKTIYRLRKFLEWCIIKLKIRLRIFLYTPVLCLWSSDDRDYDEEFDQGKNSVETGGLICLCPFSANSGQSESMDFHIGFSFHLTGLHNSLINIIFH